MNNKVIMWYIVLVMYTFILLLIGYLAFYDQDFNNQEQMIKDYISEIKKIDESESTTEQTATVSAKQEERNRDAINVVTEIIKKKNDSAGDLQELASQSFNIVLGALLAFLSASATMFFQDSGAKRKEKSSPPEKTPEPIKSGK